jgi:plasmid stabilization system protein ParE
VKSYNIAEIAERDIENIWDFIATDNPTMADRLEDEFFETFEKLSAFPGIGHRREDLTSDPGLRFFSVKRFLIVYRENHGIVEIARVFGAAQDVVNRLI